MSADWNEDAHRAVAALAATNQQFCADDVWAYLARLAPVQENLRAMGAILKYGTKHRVIAALPAWQASVRSPDRALRVFRGTGTYEEGREPTEVDVMRALNAISEVAQARSQQMVAELRKAAR